MKETKQQYNGMNYFAVNFFCVTFFLVSTFSASANYQTFETSSRVSITERGYVNMVVAIGGNVVENDRLVEVLTDVLTTFSKYLHNITGVYFKEIRILLPESWPSNTGEFDTAVTWESFENADIRIDNVIGDEVYQGHAPYTNKPSQCGSPGRYIHLTPEFVLDSIVAQSFGGHSKVLLREWAKYRWGVFDESPSGDDKHYYASGDGKIEGTRCSRKRTGQWRTKNGGQCSWGINGLPDTNCRFHDLDIAGNTSSSSIMYRQYLHGIQQFCQEQNTNGNIPEEILHNIEAPNLHNRLCDRKSIWQVMMDNPDFVSNTDEVVTWTHPDFRVIHKSSGKVVLVLDRSSSMSQFNRIDILRQAAYNFITRVIPDGLRLGIVQFNHQSEELVPLTSINDESRLTLLDKIPKHINGFTSIGAGVRCGLDVLRDVPNGNSAGGRMILITDGVNTQTPDIGSILVGNKVEISKMTIYTIAIGPDVDNDLETLANITGGRQYHHSDFSTALFDVFAQFGFEDIVKVSLELFSQNVNLMSQQMTSLTVDVDFTISNELLFLIGSSSIQSLFLEVTRPDGFTLLEYNRSEEFKLISVKTDYIMVGRWTITLNNLYISDYNISVLVEGGVSPSQPPISVDARWAHRQMTPPEAQILYVTVSMGYIPIGDAVVFANITYNSTIIFQNLWDDGIGADVRANDGIYSAFFTGFAGHGRYGTKVFVRGVADQTKVLLGRRTGTTAPSNATMATGVPPTYTGIFQRIVDAGSFKCSDEVKCKDISHIYGPAKVVDLHVENIQLDAIDLVFSAPGGDLMSGSASSYTIKVARSFNDLHNNFNHQTNVTHTISHGQVYYTKRHRKSVLNPKEARNIERFTIHLPEAGNFSYVFGMTSNDDFKNESPISNFASVSAKYLQIAFLATSLPINTPIDSTNFPNISEIVNSMNNAGSQFPWYIIIIIVISLLIISIMGILFVARIKRKKNESILLPPQTVPEPSYLSNVAFQVTESHHSEDLSSRYLSHPGAVNSVSDFEENEKCVTVNAESGLVSSAYAFVQGTPTLLDSGDSQPYEFVSIDPSSPDDKNASKNITNEIVREASISYEFVTANPHSSYVLRKSKKMVNDSENGLHLGDVYTPLDESEKGEASVVESDWRAAGGSNETFYGVQPNQDPTMEASIKSRGDKASRGKLPLPDK